MTHPHPTSSPSKGERAQSPPSSTNFKLKQALPPGRIRANGWFGPVLHLSCEVQICDRRYSLLIDTGATLVSVPGTPQTNTPSNPPPEPPVAATCLSACSVSWA
jgi:hypothetical protein